MTRNTRRNTLVLGGPEPAVRGHYPLPFEERAGQGGEHRHPGRDRQAGGEPARGGQGGDAPSGVEPPRPGGGRDRAAGGLPGALGHWRRDAASQDPRGRGVITHHKDTKSTKKNVAFFFVL